MKNRDVEGNERRLFLTGQSRESDPNRTLTSLFCASLGNVFTNRGAVQFLEQSSSEAPKTTTRIKS